MRRWGGPFGAFRNALLVGTLGDGRINVVDPIFGIPLGSPRGPDFRSIQIDGLWNRTRP